ncbi:MAG: dihydroorotase [Rhodospirillales bacterium CG15_BIG_FIL_POST_REV_8_21_14_020_66_15]|nr:MAG: dihydroorotase [Rhodospirillales bacterium CG15_BIG_FIL_POST_REV_8_21_14_020_66_15]
MAVKLDEPLGRVAYVNARILDPAEGWDGTGGVLTDGEKIAAAGPGLFDAGVPEGARVVDCEGACLAPGLVDIRAHLGEPGAEQKETLATAGRSATAGGVTTLLCLPDTEPCIDDMSVVEFVARRARMQGLTKVYPYGAVTKDLAGKEIAELKLLRDSGAVAFTDGSRSIADPLVLRQALGYAATFGLLICHQPEDPSLAGGGVMNLGENSTRLGLAGIPREAEIIIVERDIRLVEMTGGRLHFANVSTSESIEVIRRAKARGLAITCDTAPPYFALNEHAIGDYRTFAKLAPPLRDEDDRQAMVRAIADGVIDCIASDHTPQDEESKRLPFAQAASGGVGLETLLPITLELYHNGHLTLLRALDLVTRAPAALMGLEAGRLKPGGSADMVLFDPDRSWKVDADVLKSKSKNSPFDGRPVQGLVLRTVIDGRTVHTHGA